MPVYNFTVYEVDSSYYHTDAQSPILSKNALEITDSVDDDLHRTQAEDPNNDQTFSFANEPDVSDYTVQYLDFAQVNGSGPEYELYAMQVSFSDGSTKYYVMSKDDGFKPSVGDDLAVTTYSNFTSTEYGQIGSAVCFTAGTSILTVNGPRHIETLRVGDLVQTKDNGVKPILWIGKREITKTELHHYETLRPVLIRHGVLGNKQPILVSQQHRILVPKKHFDDCLSWDESFVKAKHLAEFAPHMARLAHGKRHVCYFHILLSRHEVIFADGLETESLFPGPMALQGISRCDRSEIEMLFPQLRQTTCSTDQLALPLARPCATKAHFRHQKRRMTKGFLRPGKFMRAATHVS